MVIIGLLAGYVGPKYFAQIGKSEVKAARAQIDSLGKALDQFRLDTGTIRPRRRAWHRWSYGSPVNQMGRPVPGEGCSG